jgi:L-ribulose-5-phosphate 4-epimerase
MVDGGRARGVDTPPGLFTNPVRTARHPLDCGDMTIWTTERARFVAICRRAVQMGLQTSSGGNVSMRLRAGGFLVKPSGTSLIELREEQLLVVDAQGRVTEGAGKPTKELGTHLAIYGAAQGVGAVVHYHPPYATAFAVLGRTIPLLTVHARRILRELPVLPAAAEGSPELAAALADAFRRVEVRAAVLSGHGVIAAGASLDQAQDLAELVEESARVAHLSATLP